MKILVTGGAGYIGSHLVKKLNSMGNRIVVLDNLSRGHKEAIPQGIEFENVDLRDKSALRNCLSRHKFDAVVHFAAFAYVGESVSFPGLYYDNNVLGSLNLIDEVTKAGITRFIFSSTCSVYGNSNEVPIKESAVIDPVNPYANSKYMVEKIIKDYHSSHGLNYVILRYFNAAGADPEGEIGESHEPEPHLIPNVLNTALGLNEKVSIFGDDYDTKDGTCVRDYIHVSDLADAHVASIKYLLKSDDSLIVNLGTGNGYSVKEIIDTAEKIVSQKINYEIGPRREGDPKILVADNTFAGQALGWSPLFDLQDIIHTAWNWHKNKKY
jgi:UDP-glucose 4-epimerase